MRLKNSESLTNKTPYEKRICHKFKLWVLFARRIKLMKRVNRSEWTCHDLCIESHRWSIIPKLSYQNWCNRTVLVQILNSIHGYHIFWPKIGTVVQIRIKISVFLFLFVICLMHFSTRTYNLHKNNQIIKTQQETVQYRKYLRKIVWITNWSTFYAFKMLP